MDARKSPLVAVSLGAALAFAALSACGSSTDQGALSGGDASADLEGEGGVDGGLSPPGEAEFGLDARPSNATCLAPARPASGAGVRFERVFSNLTLNTPMMLAQPPGDRTRFFVALRGGGIVRFDAENPSAVQVSLANLATLAGPARSVNTSGEGGFLGFAFHPKFADNGKVFVTWTSNGGSTGMRSEVGVLFSPDQGASFNRYETVLGPFDQPATNHNGGGIGFGTDGFLYVSFGDGGSGNDAFNNGQKKTGFFSKILRIDVDKAENGKAYGIPEGNPFRQAGGEPETFAYGFRNPYRFSIDRETGELWVGDVGQNKWEEINKVEVGGNYGWPCREGFHDYLNTNLAKCPSTKGLKDPVVEQEHIPNNSRSITGGIVYRGKAIPELVGAYLFGDYKTQELFMLSFDGTTFETKTEKLEGEGVPVSPWGSFAEDVDGELYAVSLTGGIYKMVRRDERAPSSFPERLSATGCTDPNDVKKPAQGLIPYGVNAELWSDGASKARYFSLPDADPISIRADGDLDLPNRSVLMKTFSIAGKRVETRLFMRHEDGGWAGYSYEWLEDQSDAVLLSSSKKKRVGAQEWHFPSRSECMRCHTEAAGRTLGLELGQLDGEFTYPSTNLRANQLRTLEHIGLFGPGVAASGAVWQSYPKPSGEASLTLRARSYLHANCSHCHRENGGGRSDLDLLFTTPLAEAAACNRAPETSDLDVENAVLLAPGEPARSLISIRTHAMGAGRMPPLASSVRDEAGTALLDTWIRSLTTCL